MPGGRAALRLNDTCAWRGRAVARTSPHGNRKGVLQSQHALHTAPESSERHYFVKLLGGVVPSQVRPAATTSVTVVVYVPEGAFVAVKPTLPAESVVPELEA